MVPISRCGSSYGVGGARGGQLVSHETAPSRGDPTSRDKRRRVEWRFRMDRRQQGRVLAIRIM
jgi:hypothetical protein